MKRNQFLKAMTTINKEDLPQMVSFNKSLIDEVFDNAENENAKGNKKSKRKHQLLTSYKKFITEISSDIEEAKTKLNERILKSDGVKSSPGFFSYISTGDYTFEDIYDAARNLREKEEKLAKAKNLFSSLFGIYPGEIVIDNEAEVIELIEPKQIEA